jgi:hypothetical protein
MGDDAVRPKLLWAKRERPLLKTATGSSGARSDGRVSRKPPLALARTDTGRQIKLRPLQLNPQLRSWQPQLLPRSKAKRGQIYITSSSFPGNPNYYLDSVTITIAAGPHNRSPSRPLLFFLCVLKGYSDVLRT